MSLRDDFRKCTDHDGFHVALRNDFTLCVRYSTIYHYYDFANRIRTTSLGSGAHVTEFKDIDREVLEMWHQKLKDEGGKPPALPALPKPRDILKNGLG
jgi:hypothetical protein